MTNTQLDQENADPFDRVGTLLSTGLISGHYRQAAQVVKATDCGEGPDAALMFYLLSAYDLCCRMAYDLM